jgi:hypothetical protein
VAQGVESVAEEHSAVPKDVVDFGLFLGADDFEPGH